MMNSTKETMIMITWTLGNATEQFFSPLEGRFELSVVIKFELMASTWIIRKKLSMMHLFILFHLKIFCFWLNCRSILYSTHCFRQDNDTSSTKLSMLPSWYWKELVKLSTRNLQPLNSIILVASCVSVQYLFSKAQQWSSYSVIIDMENFIFLFQLLYTHVKANAL